MSSENIKVTLILSNKTVNRVNNIKEITDETNRTRIMATGVELLEKMINEVQEGGSIFIKKKDGSEQEIKILGV